MKNLENLITSADDMAAGMEERLEKAIMEQMDRIRLAKERNVREAYWVVPVDLDVQMRAMFKEKGYMFKHVPYRSGYWGHGDYICW